MDRRAFLSFGRNTVQNRRPGGDQQGDRAAHPGTGAESPVSRAADPTNPTAHAAGDGAAGTSPGGGVHEYAGPIASDVPIPLTPFTPTASDPWDYAKAAHLLRRTMVGPTDAEIRCAVAEGLDATINRLMTPFQPSMDLIADWVGTDPCNYPPEVEGPVYDAWRVVRLGRREQAGRWWLKTIVETPVSLQERMTMFWHGHFVSSLHVSENAEWMIEQNKLFRSMWLGNFKELVRAVSKDMAMLRYLDGMENFIAEWGPHVNENYARELMELFTMGIADWNGRANYTQRDVREVARALTGWAPTPSPVSSNHLSLQSRFMRERWDAGGKNVFGKVGAWGLDDVVELIFAERAQHTARFISEKLYRWFVYTEPNREVIDAMAGMMMGASWELRPVVETLLRSAHFFRGGTRGALPKSTADFHLAVIRQIGVGNVLDFAPDVPGEPHNDLVKRLLALGHMPLNPPNVKGWRDGRAWVSGALLAPRQKFAADVVRERIGYWNGITVVKTYTFDPLEFARRYPAPEDPHLLIADVARHLLPVPATADELRALESALLSGLGPRGWSLEHPLAPERIRTVLEMLVRLPKYQLT